MISLDKQRVKEILQSKGIIEVKYKNNPVWLESISTDKDDNIQVRDLNTNKHFNVDIIDLK
ncbi:H-type small acid-soluble spore protein [Clostridium sp. WILCCON 0269]|uniref:H-type small acid-soluble spore protein n=1 Tax=Candidatus Clostridium eludens TaxID=3381663 RepID=A0ABW8SKL7_9CLOT